MSKNVEVISIFWQTASRLFGAIKLVVKGFVHINFLKCAHDKITELLPVENVGMQRASAAQCKAFF